MPHLWEKKKWFFFADNQGFEVSFLEISVPARTWRNNNIVHVQVTLFVTCLNFSGTWSRILLPAVKSCQRVKPSRKIALNSNGEVNYRELARRPCIQGISKKKKKKKGYTCPRIDLWLHTHSSWPLRMVSHPKLISKLFWLSLPRRNFCIFAWLTKTATESLLIITHQWFFNMGKTRCWLI